MNRFDHPHSVAFCFRSQIIDKDAAERKRERKKPEIIRKSMSEENSPAKRFKEEGCGPSDNPPDTYRQKKPFDNTKKDNRTFYKPGFHTFFTAFMPFLANRYCWK